MQGSFETYLKRMERDAARLEAEARNIEWLTIGLALPIAITLSLYGERAFRDYAVTSLYFSLPLGLLVALLGPPLSRGRFVRLAWAAQRHMYRRVFAERELAEFVARRNDPGAPPDYENEEILRQYIEHFVNDVTQNSAGAYSFGSGRLREKNLIRAQLMRVLARELREGLAVFSEDESHFAPGAHSLRSIPKLPAWQPPRRLELEQIEMRALQAERRPEYSKALGMTIVVAMLGYALGERYPGHSPLIYFGAAVLAPLAAVLYFYYLEHSYARLRPDLLDQLYREIFEDEMLEDFLRTRREVAAVGPQILVERAPYLVQPEVSPSKTLDWFVDYYIAERTFPGGKRGRVYRCGRARFTNMTRLRALILYSTAEGLGQIIDSDPQEIAGW